jgi:hypothetical protein
VCHSIKHPTCVCAWPNTTGQHADLFLYCASGHCFPHQFVPSAPSLVYTVLTSLTATPTLITGVYGFDQTFDYCWYETRGINDHTVLLRMILTYNLWLSIALLYLIIAATLITWSIFNTHSPLAARPTPVPQNPSYVRSHNTTNANASLAATLARRDMARRALTLRLFGYILVPTVSVISGMVLDILGESKSGVDIPQGVTDIVSALAGLMGTLNAILFAFDPSVLAVVYALRLQRARRRQQATPKYEQFGPRGRPRIFGSDLEVGEKRAVNTDGVLVITTVHRDTHMDVGTGHSSGTGDHGHHYTDPHARTETVDEGYRGSLSTVGHHIDEILQTYQGL